MKVVMLGAPGSGKGTQARQISQIYNSDHVDMGKLLRENSIHSSAAKIMNSGGLLSDDMVNAFAMKKIPIGSNFVLDGFPRTVGQARFLDTLLSNNNTKIDHLIRLVVDDDIVMMRLSQRLSCRGCGAIYNNRDEKIVCLECGDKLVIRDDDSLSVIKSRLSKYHEKNKDMMCFFGDRVVNIDGNDIMGNVTKRIVSKIDFCA